MSTLRVALAQILSGSDPHENLELVATRTAEAAANDAQLVVFPEATMRRFGLPLAEIAEPVDGSWAQQLGKIADHHQLGVGPFRDLFEAFRKEVLALDPCVTEDSESSI